MTDYRKNTEQIVSLFNNCRVEKHRLDTEIYLANGAAIYLHLYYIRFEQVNFSTVRNIVKLIDCKNFMATYNDKSIVKSSWVYKEKYLIFYSDIFPKRQYIIYDNEGNHLDIIYRNSKNRRDNMCVQRDEEDQRAIRSLMNEDWYILEFGPGRVQTSNI